MRVKMVANEQKENKRHQLYRKGLVRI